jgi:hypothetical protein
MSKRKVLGITLKPINEDRLAIHAKKHGHTLTSMATILFEEGLDARDLLEASRKEREGERG